MKQLLTSASAKRHHSVQANLVKNVLYDTEESYSNRLSKVLQYSIQNNNLSENNASALMIDLNRFKSRCNELHHAFSNAGLRDDMVKHTYAIKALPLPAIIHEINNSSFMGIECASFGELSIALASNTSPNNIVYDSPCKSYMELEYGLENNIFMNLDNFQELERVNEIINKNKNNKIDINKLKIGMRVNPAIGAGSIAATSTATKESKFGVTLDDNRDKLIDAYVKYSWLNCIHTHIGSQGCPVQMIGEGIGKIVNFVEELNNNYGQDYTQIIDTIDIGGGLPINYETCDDLPSFHDLVDEYKRTAPVIFTNKYKIYTEFGRSLISKSGFIVSRVEYTKQVGNGKDNRKSIATIHCGGNMLVREVYNPHIWKHYISVYDKYGNEKRVCEKNQEYRYDIVGPLCFSGDIIGKDLIFPFEIQPNDYVIIHDCGGYSLGMYSMYNSREFPPIYGFDHDQNQFKILKKGQTKEDVVNFWLN